MISTAYDDEADALYVRIAAEDAKVMDTREVEPGVILDFDAEGRVIGIEILSARAPSTGPNRGLRRVGRDHHPLPQGGRKPIQGSL